MTGVARWLMPIAAMLALIGCGGGGSGSSASSSSSGTSSSSSSSGSNNNTAPVVVGAGPTAASSAFNIPTTSVTVCQPGTSTCTTITHVLVDTGSSGLRLLSSALGSLTLSGQPDPANSSNRMAECLSFVDGYVWGGVAVADVTVGTEKASGVAVHIIDDSGTNAIVPAPPASCTGTGKNLSSLDSLSANGVLGVGLFADDCGAYCAQAPALQTAGNVYYSCGSSCAPASEAEADQVTNPVARFLVDNNGVILELPAIPANGQTTASGTLIFGIGTQSNNAVGSAAVLTTDSVGNITATYNGQTLSGSFVDSGSNGLYFPNSSLSTCTGSSGASDFYCPTSSPFAVPATLMGTNGKSSAANLEIVSLNGLDQTFFAVNVGGPVVGSSSGANFDFGLPFFFGRNVFIAIEGKAADGTTGPYYAF
jgi:hypothetical protein